MLTRNPKSVITNFWQLKLGIIASMGLLFICCQTVFTWYPFALYSNLGAAFVAIAAFTIFIIVWKFIKTVRSHDYVLYFLRGTLACIAALAILTFIVTSFASQPKQIAVVSLNNQQFQLLYPTNCLEFCIGELIIYRCDFLGVCPVFDKTAAYIGWAGGNRTSWELRDIVKEVRLSIDPSSEGINVSYDGKIVHTFKSP